MCVRASLQWVALKQRAQAVHFTEAVRAKGLTLWEAFTAIDCDNNGMLSPSEVYGALVWLQVRSAIILTRRISDCIPTSHPPAHLLPLSLY